MSPLPLLLMGFSPLTSDVDDIPQIPGVEATFYIWAVSRGRGVGFLSSITGPDLLTLLRLSAICYRERG